MTDRSDATLLLIIVTVVVALFASAHAARGQCDMIPDCELVWSDEFAGTGVDPAKWEFQFGDGTAFGIPGWGNNELQWYQSDNATVSGGMLTIEAREQTVGGYNYTSSRMRTIGLGDFLYGRFEMRADLPVGQGMWPAFWMLPSTSAYGIWAASGEIDIVEAIGADQIYGTIHFGGEAPANTFDGANILVPGATTGFHTYAVEWEPTEIRWYVDSQLYSTKTSWFSTAAPYPAPFDVNFHMLLNLAVGGNFPGNPNPSTVFPQHYVIDYVRVYQQAPPDPELAARCEASKVKATGKYSKCLGKVFSKAIKKSEAADASKLISCSGKLTQKFLKAEAKAEGSCQTVSDVTSIESAVDTCIDDAVTALGGVPGPGGDEAKCQSRKVKEAGKYADCRFKTSFKSIKKGITADFTKCESKITSKWAKIETKPCSTTGDLANIQAGIDTCHATLLGSLGGPGCGNNVVDPGEQCDDGNTVSGDGCSSACQSENEYELDLESLVQSDPAALSNEGWLVGANVFAGPPPGGAFIYNYFSFAAPNGGSAFCGVDVGQGGPLQGAQQLVVYNDYNNTGEHDAGNTVEAFVFRERTVGGADIGNTIELSFDAKLGNLTGSSTAEVFIKTLDPNAGFSVSGSVSQNTTSIPGTWGSYSIALDLTANQNGHLLQYGFSNKATSYIGSGVFYDNILVTLTPTP